MVKEGDCGWVCSTGVFMMASRTLSVVSSSQSLQDCAIAKDGRKHHEIKGNNLAGMSLECEHPKPGEAGERAIRRH